MPLDKNPGLLVDGDMAAIRDELGMYAPSIVLCQEAFHKAEFLDKMVGSAGRPVILVDTDLLYTGYLRASMIPERDGVRVIRPGRDDWRERFSEVIARASEGRILVILDTFNGAYRISGGSWPARTVNSCVMLLARACRQSGSHVVAAALAREREDGRWVLSPGGWRVARSGGTGVFVLGMADEGLAVSRLEP